MKLAPNAAARLFAAADVGRLATTGPDGPHVVPIVFAVVGSDILTMVDEKPKSTRRLRRLANIAQDRRVSVLVDHFEADWRRLWWVRADGNAEIVSAGAAIRNAQTVLAAKYPHYRDRPPPGPLIRIAVGRWVGWAASPDAVAER